MAAQLSNLIYLEGFFLRNDHMLHAILLWILLQKTCKLHVLFFVLWLHDKDQTMVLHNLPDSSLGLCNERKCFGFPPLFSPCKAECNSKLWLLQHSEGTEPVLLGVTGLPSSIWLYVLKNIWVLNYVLFLHSCSLKPNSSYWTSCILSLLKLLSNSSLNIIQL